MNDDKKNKRLNRFLYTVPVLLFLGIFIFVGFVIDSSYFQHSEQNQQKAAASPAPSLSQSPTPAVNSTSGPTPALVSGVEKRDSPSPTPETPSRSDTTNQNPSVVGDKVASAINYLFVAASVLLGLVGKLMLEPLLGDKSKNIIQSARVLILLRHAAVECLISIVYGFFTYMYLMQTDLDVAEWQLRTGFFCQMLSLLFGGVLLMLAVNSVVKHHLQVKGKHVDD